MTLLGNCLGNFSIILNCHPDGDNADGDQMEVAAAAAASGSKRGADGEKRDDDKVMKAAQYWGALIYDVHKT